MDKKFRYNFERMCRVCLLECTKMIHLFDSGRNISEIVMTCSNIKINKNDGLPAQICQECLQQVDNAWSFKQKCGNSDVKLRNYIMNAFQDHPEIEFKMENNDLGITEFNDFLKYEISEASIDSSISKCKVSNNSLLNESLECPLCKENLQSRIDFINHVLLKHAPLSDKQEGYQCELCKRKYIKEFELKKHLVSHKEFTYKGTTNVCPICEEHFLRHEVLVRHAGYHLEESIHNCSKCNCFFTSSLHLKRHIQRRHKQNNTVCNISAEDLVLPKQENSDSLYTVKIEPIQELDDPDSSFETKFTDEVGNGLNLEDDFIDGIDDSNYLENTLSDGAENFSDSDFVAKELFPDTLKKISKKANKRKRMMDDLLDESTDIKIEPGYSDFNNSEGKTISIIEGQKSQKKRKYIKSEKTTFRSTKLSCDECHKRFLKPQLLADHLKRHRGERSYLCSVCGKGYYKQSHLDKHILSHSNSTKQTYECPLCGKIVPHSNHLQLHMRAHKDKLGDHSSIQQIMNPNKKVHLCSTCGRSCSSRSNLAVHMRRHTGTMTSICKICGKGYPRTTDLTLHMRKHTGERPFICYVCQKGFARSDKLAIHMRTHTGEKPYICTMCGRSFAQSNDLASHKKRNTCNHNLVSPSNIRSNNLSLNESDNESNILLLAQSRGNIEISPASSTVCQKIETENGHSEVSKTPSKLKQNCSTKQSPLPNSKIEIEDNETEEKVFDLELVTSNNILVISDNDVHNKVIGLIDQDITSKQNLLLSDVLSNQRALDLATVNHSIFNTQQRSAFIDYPDILAIQPTNYGMR